MSGGVQGRREGWQGVCWGQVGEGGEEGQLEEGMGVLERNKEKGDYEVTSLSLCVCVFQCVRR